MNTNPLNLSSEIAQPLPQAGLGHKDLQHQGKQRLLQIALTYVVAMAALTVAVMLGLAEGWLVALVISYTAAGLITFFFLLRSEATARSADPMLIFPQVLFNISLVSLVYALLEIARGFALEWLCLIIVFDMERLGRRQTLIAAAMAMVLPSLGVCLIWLLRPDSIDLANQLTLLMMGAFLVPVLLAVSAASRKVRWRSRKQKEEMAQALAQLRQLSIRDSLTGLYNRSHMQSLLEEEVRRQQRTGRPFSIAMLDIDFFKRVNDKFGHAVGDAVLREFAALGRAAFERQTDSLARWGGEEFLLLMPDTTQAQAYATMVRMRALVTSHDWSRQHKQLQVDFSAGVCEHREGVSLLQTMEAADQALYRAKAQGRSRIEPAMPLSAGEPAASEAVRAAAMARKPMSVDDDLSEMQAAGPHDSTGKWSTRSSARPLRESKWKIWLLGTDPEIREALPLCIVASGTYIAIMLFTIFHGIPTGIYSHKVAMFILPMDCLGAFVPYILVRSGLSARWKDRGLVVPQMIWALMLLVLCYGFVPDIRPYELAMMCQVLVFGFVNLMPKQAMVVGMSVVSMLALMYFALLVAGPAKFDPAREGLSVAVTIFIFMLLTYQSRNFALKREQLRQERRELVATTEQVNKLMRRDVLTGLYNRQHMQSLLESECDRHERSGFGLCVALLDLDHFKTINDEYGHQAGDEALGGFALAAKESLRDTDVIGRWGGEEFLVLLVDSQPSEQGLLAIERLREHVASRRFCIGAPTLVVTLSAGLTLRKSGESSAQLLERADRALYQAKEQGRNRSVVA